MLYLLGFFHFDSNFMYEYILINTLHKVVMIRCFKVTGHKTKWQPKH